MRKHFDYLLRSTYFLVGNGPLDGVIETCKDLGFRHLLLGQYCWSRSTGWYESSLPGGHGDLKRFIQDCHAEDILVSLHTRTTRVTVEDPLVIEPKHPDLEFDGSRHWVDPYSPLHDAMAARLVAVADLVGADGLYLDGAEMAVRNHRDKPATAIIAGQKAVIDKLTRPMLLQSSSSPSELHEYWSWVGQLDHYINRKKVGFEGTRDDWYEQYFRFVNQALSRGYPSQLGWIDVGHGQTAGGEPIEDQSPESLKKLTDWAAAHNVPIVLETTLEEFESHPQVDELEEVIRNFHFRGR